MNPATHLLFVISWKDGTSCSNAVKSRREAEENDVMGLSASAKDIQPTLHFILVAHAASFYHELSLA